MRCRVDKPLPKTALRYVLESLIPYTEANLKLSFSPGLFFNDLESIERQKRAGNKTAYRKSTLRKAYYRAAREGLISLRKGSHPLLTEEAKVKLKPYRPERLGEHAYLMVAFDIPEKLRPERDHFRSILKELDFMQVQKSVWQSKNDARKLLLAEVDFHDLTPYVDIYEVVKIS